MNTDINEFIQECRYALYACPPGEPRSVLHVAFYINQPTEADLNALVEELRTYEKFRLESPEFDIMEATGELLDHIRSQLDTEKHEMVMHDETR